MAKIIKVIRTVNKGAAAIVYVQLDHGGESEVWVGGDVKEVDHMGKSKSYVILPWHRPNQSKKKLD